MRGVKGHPESCKARGMRLKSEGVPGKIFLTAMPLTDLSELEVVKREIRLGNIVVLRLTPLAHKSLDDVKLAISELLKFVESIGGDVGRLGVERVVLCPANVKIRRPSQMKTWGRCI